MLPVAKVRFDTGPFAQALYPVLNQPISMAPSNWELKKGDTTWIAVAHGTALPEHEKVAATYQAVHGLLDSWGMLSGSPHIKEAAFEPYSPTLRGVGELSGYLPGGQLSWQIPGVPRHLTGMLGGGILGAGMGYGLGYLGTRLLPQKWNRDRTPCTFAALGAAVGAAPGMAGILSNLAAHRGIGDDSLFQMPPANTNSSFPNTPHYMPGPQFAPWFTPNPEYNPNMPHVLPHDYDQIPNLKPIEKPGGANDARPDLADFRKLEARVGEARRMVTARSAAAKASPGNGRRTATTSAKTAACTRRRSTSAKSGRCSERRAVKLATRSCLWRSRSISSGTWCGMIRVYGAICQCRCGPRRVVSPLLFFMSAVRAPPAQEGKRKAFLGLDWGRPWWQLDAL
jgi:hypothetical protein